MAFHSTRLMYTRFKSMGMPGLFMALEADGFPRLPAHASRTRWLLNETHNSAGRTHAQYLYTTTNPHAKKHHKNQTSALRFLTVLASDEDGPSPSASSRGTAHSRLGVGTCQACHYYDRCANGCPNLYSGCFGDLSQTHFVASTSSPTSLPGHEHRNGRICSESSLHALM